MSSSDNTRNLRGSKRQIDCKSIPNCFNQPFLFQKQFQLPPLVRAQVTKSKNINCYDILSLQFKPTKDQEALQLMRIAATNQINKASPMIPTQQQIQQEIIQQNKPQQIITPLVTQNYKMMNKLQSPIRYNMSTTFDKCYGDQYFSML